MNKPGIGILLLFPMLLLSSGIAKTQNVKSSEFRAGLQPYLNAITDMESYSSQKPAWRKLQAEIKRKELLRLMDSESPPLRAAAFSILVYRMDSDCVDLMFRHLDDTARFTSAMDDTDRPLKVADQMLYDLDKLWTITRAEKDALMDSVIFHHTELENFAVMLSSVEPYERYYSPIRAASQNADSKYARMCATSALAKYRKKEDIPLLLKNITSSTLWPRDEIFKAIEAFPDPAFEPFLSDNSLTDTIWNPLWYEPEFRHYCRAVAACKNQNSLKILEGLARKDHGKKYTFRLCVLEALQKHPDPLYENLLREIQLKEDPDPIIQDILRLWPEREPFW